MDAAAASLLKVAGKIDQGIADAPSFLLVLTSGGYAYRRKGGACVVPFDVLGS